MKARTKSLRSQRTAERRGVAAVEFAVVAPLLLLLVLGILEYGRGLMAMQALTMAAREGARQAAVHGVAPSAVEATVVSHLGRAGISRADVTVSPSSPGAAQHGQPVSVEVSVAYRHISWLPTPKFMKDKVLRSTAVMRRETPF